MKKLVSLLLALVMCASLAACGGGPDKQPAIDAQDSAVKAINEVSALLNENSDKIEDFSEIFNQMVSTLDEFGEQLADDDLTQEQLDAIVKGCGEIEDWAKEAKTEIEELLGN